MLSRLDYNTEDMDTADEPYWFIFVCRNNCVMLAQEWFESWTKCECYYPIAKKYTYPKRFRTDFPTIVEKPALGGYLFARFYEEINWKMIREQNSHVMQWLKVLMDPETGVRVPATISNEKIMQLKRVEACGKFDDMSPDQRDCALSKVLKDQPVHIPYGQFFGVRGATVESVWRKIVKIKVKVLGKDVLLTFPCCDIFPDWEERR